MLWQRTLPSVVAIPVVLLVLSVALDLWVAVPLTAIAIWVSAGLLALTLAAFAIINITSGLVLRGKLKLLPASRCSYMIALLTASMTFMVGDGILYPLLVSVPLMSVLGFYWPEFSYFLMVFCLFSSAWGLFKILTLNSSPDTVEPLHAWGILVNSSSQQELFVVLDRLSNSLQMQTPTHILLGIDPSVSYTAELVLLEDAALEGGTLHLSLPLFRLLSEAEVMSLILVELLRS